MLWDIVVSVKRILVIGRFGPSCDLRQMKTDVPCPWEHAVHLPAVTALGKCKELWL